MNTKNNNTFKDLYELGKQVVSIPNLSYVDILRKNIVLRIKELDEGQVMHKPGKL